MGLNPREIKQIVWEADTNVYCFYYHNGLTYRIAYDRVARLQQ